MILIACLISANIYQDTLSGPPNYDYETGETYYLVSLAPFATVTGARIALFFELIYFIFHYIRCYNNYYITYGIMVRTIYHVMSCDLINSFRISFDIFYTVCGCYCLVLHIMVQLKISEAILTVVIGNQTI